MKIGTIGTGFIVDTIIEAATLHNDIEFVAVYSRNEDTGTRFANKYNIKYVFDDMDTFLDSDLFDTVYIASPNSLHFQQTLKALEQGKNVIVEKPFAGNSVEAKAMIAKAKEKGLFLFEAITNIYLPHYQIIKDNLGSIGDVKVVDMNMSQLSSRYQKLTEGIITNVFNPEFYGGSLMDLNIYNIHLLVALFGKPDTISYIANLYENGVDVSGSLSVQYPNLIGNLIAAKDSMGKNYVNIQGDKGYIYVESSSSMLSKVEITLKGVDTIIYNEQTYPTHYYEFATFEEIMKNKNYDLCYKKLEHSLEVIEVVEKALEQVGLKYGY